LSLYASDPSVTCADGSACPHIVVHVGSGNPDVQLRRTGWAELEVHFEGAVLIVDWVNPDWPNTPPTTPPCPADPLTVSSIVQSIREWRRYEFGGYGVIRCHGSKDLTLTGRLTLIEWEAPGPPSGPPVVEPAWLFQPLDVELAPADGLTGGLWLFTQDPGAFDLRPGNLVKLTGHFDDERSASCHPTWSDMPQALEVMSCREHFVVTQLTVVARSTPAP
jgi:hypothetical protein